MPPGMTIALQGRYFSIKFTLEVVLFPKMKGVAMSELLLPMSTSLPIHREAEGKESKRRGGNVFLS